MRNNNYPPLTCALMAASLPLVELLVDAGAIVEACKPGKRSQAVPLGSCSPLSCSVAEIINNEHRATPADVREQNKMVGYLLSSGATLANLGIGVRLYTTVCELNILSQAAATTNNEASKHLIVKWLLVGKPDVDLVERTIARFKN